MGQGLKSWRYCLIRLVAYLYIQIVLLVVGRWSLEKIREKIVRAWCCGVVSNVSLSLTYICVQSCTVHVCMYLCAVVEIDLAGCRLALDVIEATAFTSSLSIQYTVGSCETGVSVDLIRVYYLTLSTIYYLK